MKKILIVDDSALMRRVICDIINSDERFSVVDRATNGVEALDLLIRKEYDAVILDVNMPKMNGLELLEELRKRRIKARVVMASTDTREGAKTTLDALSLGAIDFVHKPDNPLDCKNGVFNTKLLNILATVCESKASAFEESPADKAKSEKATKELIELAHKFSKSIKEKQIVALASSTGGPKALQEVIPKIPASLKCPVVIVQHMPAGFTQSLAERLNDLSECTVTEAKEGDILKDGHVYIAKGGKHLNVDSVGGQYKIRYSDEPNREGVKPSANYMYESLANGMAERIVCVVLTGMGADGTAGIANLKKSKKTFVISQNEESCTVYGMPKAVAKAGLSDSVVPLNRIAQEIIMNVGVN
ncbi:MAG: chemotaxis response regulator protein-glutamate methylesterase [Lachnospiraceae bacterium]|nr:chemotaxis response regulator protein-glutamate methylesterase [Lachnospiraceae bacterium]